MIELIINILTTKVRIVEHNSVYDDYFGEGKGWIYYTNYMSLLQAKIFERANKRAFKEGWYSIDYNA